MENMFYLAMAMGVFTIPFALYPLIAFGCFVKYRKDGGRMSLKKYMDRW